MYHARRSDKTAIPRVDPMPATTPWSQTISHHTLSLLHTYPHYALYFVPSLAHTTHIGRLGEPLFPLPWFTVHRERRHITLHYGL